MEMTRAGYLILDRADNVAVALRRLDSGERLQESGVVVCEPIPAGHKIAIAEIKTGSAVIKYGRPIGFATKPIAPGEHVHVDALTLGRHVHDYRPGTAARPAALVPADKRRSFAGYPRADGKVGTRNYLGIVATVSCSGDVAQMIADAVSRQLLPHYPEIDGVVAVTHGSGCCLAPDGEGLAILQRNDRRVCPESEFRGDRAGRSGV